MIVIAVAAVVGVIAMATDRRGKAKGKRASGALTGAFGAVDQVFRLATHHANTIQEAETRMPAPAPLAGGRGPGGDRI